MDVHVFREVQLKSYRHRVAKFTHSRSMTAGVVYDK
jgi:hypothetical protein